MRPFNVVLLTALCKGTPSSSPGGYGTGACSTIPNYAIGGPDLKFFPGTFTAAECCSLCPAVKGCGAYTTNVTGCALKADTTGLKPLANSTSGNSAPATPTPPPPAPTPPLPPPPSPPTPKCLHGGKWDAAFQVCIMCAGAWIGTTCQTWNATVPEATLLAQMTAFGKNSQDQLDDQKALNPMCRQSQQCAGWGAGKPGFTQRIG